MPTTGEEFDKLWYRRVDKPYNSYYGTVQRQRLYKQALFYALEAQYNGLIVQGQYDEIRSMVKVDHTVTPVSDTVIINTMLPDYLHYLYSEAKYEGNSFPFSSFSYSGSGPIKAFSDKVLPLRTGDFVVISGCADMNEANGSFYLKQIGRTTYALYLNADLTNPATATVFSGNEATAIQYFFGKCMVQYSDQRIQVLDSPSRNNPRVMISNNAIKIFPTGCLELRIDYVTNPPVFIDPANNTFDLETVYPMKFLYQIIDKAAEIFDVETKDPQSFQQDTILEKSNE
jgi:hypothetical protein